MRMYTKNALMAFGNFLLTRSESSNMAVEDQDVTIWLENYEAALKEWNTLPSSHQIDDRVFINFNKNLATRQVGEVVAVHFHGSKVRYDIQIEAFELTDETGEKEQYYTRLYNVDGAFVSVRE